MLLTACRMGRDSSERFSQLLAARIWCGQTGNERGAKDSYYQLAHLHKILTSASLVSEKLAALSGVSMSSLVECSLELSTATKCRNLIPMCVKTDTHLNRPSDSAFASAD